MTALNTQHLRYYPEKPKQVYLYGTCLADTLYPDSGIDAITLLEQQGIEVTHKNIDSEQGPASFSFVDPDGNAILIDQHR